jgi:invasion protein IalB
MAYAPATYMSWTTSCTISRGAYLVVAVDIIVASSTPQSSTIVFVLKKKRTEIKMKKKKKKKKKEIHALYQRVYFQACFQVSAYSSLRVVWPR